MTFIDILNGGPTPKRGDLVQTNLGNKRERTWLILRAKRAKRAERTHIPRFNVWMARWWELEPEMRLALFRSAERAGGQNVIHFKRYPSRRTRTSPESLASAFLSDF